VRRTHTTWCKCVPSCSYSLLAHSKIAVIRVIARSAVTVILSEPAGTVVSYRLVIPTFTQVSKKKSAKANAGDYHEWSVNEKLKPHPNVLQIVGLCPSFRHRGALAQGTTALISPLQVNGDLKSFLKKCACYLRTNRI